MGAGFVLTPASQQDRFWRLDDLNCIGWLVEVSSGLETVTKSQRVVMRGREGKGSARKTADPRPLRVFDPHITHKQRPERKNRLPYGEREERQVVDSKGIGMSSEVVYDDNVRAALRKTAKLRQIPRTDC